MARAISPDPLLDRPNQPAQEFGAVLVGFDVEGFSRTVEKAALRHGRGAGELAAQRILAGERIATQLAGEAGLRFADALGDGAVYMRAQEPPSARDVRALLRFQEELKYAHLKHTGLSVRTAWAHGPVRLTRPRAIMLEHSEVLWGPAVAQLHATLSSRPRGRRLSRESDAERPDLADREGEIAEMTFVFLRLRQSTDWAGVDETALDDALGLIGRWAERLSGRLERITHDEKGLHVRVGLPGVNAAVGDWREILRGAQAPLQALGFDGAIAAAGGPVYRGPSEHGSTIVHGGAVNRAAKLCAGLPPGGLAVDPSLAAPAVRAPRGASAVVGRRAEIDKAKVWLAAGGPRMVVLSGPAGIGKSHLLRDLLAGDEGESRAFVGGAPARMLDPMGAWFELLSQGLARRRPEADDRAWATHAFEAAGLPASMLPLCARALRGVEAANAQTVALEGGERASRLKEGLLALIEALARDGPLLAAIDDLHELDDASLDLTVSILSRGLPVRIIATARPAADRVRAGELQRHLSTLEIALEPLSAPEITTLVGSLTGGELDADEVMAVSGGNPFEAIQAALALAEDGRSAGEQTLEAILGGRLDRLDTDEREVLRALSVSDRSWTAEDLDAIARATLRSRPTPETLARLASARLIEPAAGDPAAFQSAHRLLTETVRRRMPAGVGRGLARGAARRLTRIDGADSGASVVEIARLWALAGSPGRAAILYERAAKAAATEGADAVCVRLLTLALELFDGEMSEHLPRRAVRWLAELSRARWSLGLVDTANRAARLAVARAHLETLPPRLGDSALAASAMRAETGQFLGDLREIFFGSLAAGRFGTSSREHLSAQGRGFSALGYLLGLMRLAGPADRILRRGERLASDADPRPAAFALTARAILCFIFTRWPQGEAALAQAHAICAAWPQHQLMEIIETTQGIGAHLHGDGERALAHFASLSARAKARGSSLHAGWADYATAQTLLALDRPHEAWARLESAEDRLGGLGDRQSLHICRGLRARLAWSLGEVDDALSAAASCGEMSRGLPPTNYSSTEAYSAPALVGALALTADVTHVQRRAALTLVRRHLGDLERYAWVFPIARPRLALVKALIAGGRSPPAARLETVAAGAERMGLFFEAALARRLRDDIARKS